MLLKATNLQKLNIVALDVTCMARPLPSPYYYKRIYKPYLMEVTSSFQLQLTPKQKILYLRFRTKFVHDVRDARYLIDHLSSKPR